MKVLRTRLPRERVVWLISALSILLGLFRRFFGVKGAFIAERPNREVYVSLDGVIYLLLYNLYGLKDAAKVFNYGLVEHLRKEGYNQSLWDECLFGKNLALSYQNKENTGSVNACGLLAKKTHTHTHTQVKSPPSDPCAI